MKNSFLLASLACFSTFLQAQSITASMNFSQADANTYTWPITVSGGSAGNPVIITLSENLTLSQINQYFIIQSDYIILEGNNKTITVNNVVLYPGLVQNGTLSAFGFSFITIRNITLLSINSTLADEGGWLGQSYFGNTGWMNLFSNCNSDGNISNYGGGITGSNSSNDVTRCRSSGSILFAGGGIFGSQGSGTATNCYSTGTIGVYAGGIFGFNSSGYATDCYSTGSMNSHGAGIFAYVSSGTASRCYSTGSINDYSGGISGESFSGAVSNCYSTGQITLYSGGIVARDNIGTINNSYTSGSIDGVSYGIVASNNTGTITNCFAGNGSWVDTDAMNYLSGVGTTWVSIMTNTPYKLSSFNAAIYSPNNAVLAPGASSDLIAGNFINGSYSIISISGVPAGYPTITINAGTGMLSVANAVAGTYLIKVIFMKNTNGAYEISNFNLDVYSTLPVTWRSFTVTAREAGAWLQWSTSSEQNSRDFTVQHSIDGTNWETHHSQAASGNSSIISKYNWLHMYPAAGMNYYRIRQSDLDGDFSYSPVQVLKLSTSIKTFSVINTIVNNSAVRVSVKSPGILYLFTNDGKLAWSQHLKSGIATLNFGSIAPGIYFLKGGNAFEKIIFQ